MRLVVSLTLGLIALMTAPAGAATCKRGKVIYRLTVTSLVRGEAVDNLDGIIKQVFEVRDGGAWERIDDGKVTASGCLKPVDLAHFKDGVRRTKLKIDNQGGGGACIATPSRRVLVELPMRKKRRETREPCGPPLDSHTGRLSSCLWAEMESAHDPEHVTSVCKDG